MITPTSTFVLSFSSGEYSHKYQITSIKYECTRLGWSWVYIIQEGGDASDNLSNFLNLKFKLEEEKSNTQGNTFALILECGFSLLLVSNDQNLN